MQDGRTTGMAVGGKEAPGAIGAAIKTRTRKIREATPVFFRLVL